MKTNDGHRGGLARLPPERRRLPPTRPPGSSIESSNAVSSGGCSAPSTAGWVGPSDSIFQQLDASAGRADSWLILLLRGARWPEWLERRLLASTVIILAEQPAESPSSLASRIERAAASFPEHARSPKGIVLGTASAPPLARRVAHALSAVLAHHEPAFIDGSSSRGLDSALSPKLTRSSRLTRRRPDAPQSTADTASALGAERTHGTPRCRRMSK